MDTLRIPSDPRCTHDAPHDADGCTETLTYSRGIGVGTVHRCGCRLTQAQHDAPMPADGYGTRPPSCRRFDVLGGPGGYLSARHVGAMRADEYVDGWERLVRVNVPRRIRPTISPRTVYLDVLRHYRAGGAMV